ncbi:ATP-binding protein [Telmatospirillum sp. J64-1]|uniref:ATP-binding protein n=1 Tax=Telmatospirillum sp. J64-1 TaxID=2502183 RepID=UPI00115C5059|nr:ATP-binding protein [Telmatospirillum sp. J64-1]
MTLRRLLPDSIAGWTMLVLVAGLILAQFVGFLFYTGHRMETLTALGGRQAADRVAGVVHLAEETPRQNRREVLRSLDMPGLRIVWTQVPRLRRQGEDSLSRMVAATLSERLDDRRLLVSVLEGPPPPPQPLDQAWTQERHHRPWHGVSAPGLIRISVQLSDGSWLNFVAPIDLDQGAIRPRFAGPFLLVVLVVAGFSLWAVSRATRPLARFAAAAERLGVDVAAPPLPESGPREVRRAAHAFNEMQTRLRRYIDDRTQMLAAISHDLRTPITRLRLRAEFVDDDEQRTKMLADLAEMEAMIAATLAFARDDAATEAREPIDLAALCQGLAEDFAMDYDGPETLAAEARPLGLKRALTNLMDNARKYGGDARIVLTAGKAEAVVEIIDSGPGIPPEELDRVFAPFHRVERSRSRETGGVGLGLSVARNILRAHGGDITLSNRPEGGLKATMVLPLAG